MTRHFLMLGVGLLCCTVVLSQLQERKLASNPDAKPLPVGLLDVVEAVDNEFEAHWQSQQLEVAERADNLLIARRLSLALTGTVPSLEEIRAFDKIPHEQQIDWWLTRLLNDRRCSDYTAERFARAFVGTVEGDFIAFRRRRFVSWLSDQLDDNKPYDEIVRALISDRGSWMANPAVNFITVTNGTDEEGQPDVARLAARTTRAFLGVRLDCMQCHDDNLGGDWLQSDFHQLAAFYTEARSSGLGIQDDTDRTYDFQYLHAEDTEVVAPKLPFMEELEMPEGDLPRRAQLAAWITHPENGAFARATVNRVWAILFSRPLVEPIDDIPLEGPYPPGLELLAQDFAEHEFDLRRLISQIAMTRAFQNNSRADFEITPEHEENWATFPLTRLRPEQVAGSIVQSSALPTIDSNSHILRQFVYYTEVGDFVKRYGDSGEDEFDDRGGTIPQRLVMLNGELVKEHSKDGPMNAATRIAQQVRDDGKAIESVFLVTLSRLPTEKEKKHFAEQLADPELKTSRVHKLEDIYWSLLNSTEFSWNH